MDLGPRTIVRTAGAVVLCAVGGLAVVVVTVLRRRTVDRGSFAESDRSSPSRPPLEYGDRHGLRPYAGWGHF